MSTKTTKQRHTFVKFVGSDDDLHDEVFVWARVLDLVVKDGSFWGFEVEVVDCVTHTKDGNPVTGPENGSKGELHKSCIVATTQIDF